MRLFDNPFSPFCRKVRMVLDHKGLPYESIDALSEAQRDALEAANPRAEVPALRDGDLTVVNSADIVAYLDHRYPDPPVYPADPATRAQARAWERLADTTVDAIIHDISIWTWFTVSRTDAPPEGLVDAGVREIQQLYDQLETALGDDGFLCGDLSVADLALFPHIGSAGVLGIAMTDAHPKLRAWFRRVREQECCRKDLRYVRESLEAAMAAGDRTGYERTRIKWRGDRLEWLLSRGFHEWWYAELAEGRVEWPMRGGAAFPVAFA